MPDGNILAALGFDIQLLAAGACGGMVRAIFDRQTAIDAAKSMLASSITANFLAGAAASFFSAVNLGGIKVSVNPGIAAFIVGFFAFLILGILAAKLRGKFGGPR